MTDHRTDTPLHTTLFETDRAPDGPGELAGRRAEADADFADEQAYIQRAHDILDEARAAAVRLRELAESGRGGTYAARFERDVLWDAAAQRSARLDIGDASLCFGRIDQAEGEKFYIGRVAVSDEHQEPVIVDWRAPVAEAFYRATGAEPWGLERRRHFATRGRTLLGIDDEFFGAAVEAAEHGRLRGQGALMAALESTRSGKLGDIVATIQGEQDRVVRSELQGVLVVQGGPGTGKTVVALHRAAYLLYAHRFPLEGEGMLVVGPNRLFLSYIDQVLPSLGESGVHLAVLADLVPHVRVGGYDSIEVAHLKADLRMVRLLKRAVRDRQRALRTDLVIGYGIQKLRLTVERSRLIVAAGRHRFRTHNRARHLVESMFWEALTESARRDLDVDEVRSALRRDPDVRYALEWMWPVLTPAQLLNDLFGGRGLLRSAAGTHLDGDEAMLLHSPRVGNPAERRWTYNDVPLLDEALELLGPRPGHTNPDEANADVIRTYGHIVVDEAQDLSPMELRMLDRRSLNGSMTVVGDIAQSTGPWAHDDWDSVLHHLPTHRGSRQVELVTGYRVPGPIMELASRVLPLAAPGLTPPVSIRETGTPPGVVHASDGDFERTLVGLVLGEREAVGEGSVAVVTPGSWTARCEAALTAAAVDFGQANRSGLSHQVTVVPVTLVKGLEQDSVIVVEPAAILESEYRGPQALYVALTRSTRRLHLLHVAPLPAFLHPDPLLHQDPRSHPNGNH